MTQIGAVLIAAVVILAGFGGSGPMHSGRCRGEAVAAATPSRTLYATCTRTGWRYRSVIIGPIGHR